MADYPIFPRLPGFSWSNHKIPVWKTLIQEPEEGAGLERRWSRWATPRWRFSLPVELLRSDRTSSNELKQIIAFFNGMMGAAQQFLLDEREDTSQAGVTGQVLGTGNGVTKNYQLIHRYTHNYGEWVETCRYINPRKNFGYGEGGYGEERYGTAESPFIYLDGVEVDAGYSITDAGVVQFVTAPALDVIITADFSYFYLVRFDGDEQDLENLFMNRWRGEIRLITVKEP